MNRSQQRHPQFSLHLRTLTSCAAAWAAQRYSQSSVAFICGHESASHSSVSSTARSLSSMQNCLREGGGEGGGE